jgi:hypothetical protein
MDYSLKESQTLGAVRDAIQPLVPIFAKLSPEELQAFDLMNRGLVTPERLDAYQSRVQEAISGNRPEGENIADIGPMLILDLLSSEPTFLTKSETSYSIRVSLSLSWKLPKLTVKLSKVESHPNSEVMSSEPSDMRLSMN